MDTVTVFAGAFPWFGHDHWGWEYDANDECGPAYIIRPTPPVARGSIAIFMPGTGHERVAAMTAWLNREYRPRFEVPATRIMKLGKPSAVLGHCAHLNPRP